MEITYRRMDETMVEFENDRVSTFLTKFLDRINAANSERSRYHALNRILIQQVGIKHTLNYLFLILLTSLESLNEEFYERSFHRPSEDFVLTAKVHV